MTCPLRHTQIIRLLAGWAASFCASLSAEVIVNPPQTITHRVEVQPVRVRNTAGDAATTFGTAAVETYIKAQINRVWAQVGVRIDWLPVVDFTNNFAYDGSPGIYTVNPRPQNHLDIIVDTAGVPPKHADPKVLNMFFVEISPGFYQLDDDAANGLAFIDENGLAIHVGTELLSDIRGRDIIASVLAHEIGHNLGLEHVRNDDNLMGSNGTTERLTAAQKKPRQGRHLQAMPSTHLSLHYHIVFSNQRPLPHYFEEMEEGPARLSRWHHHQSWRRAGIYRRHRGSCTFTHRSARHALSRGRGAGYQSKFVAMGQ